ncbi:MAG: DUF1802 family protein [Oscillatoriaceae bacterium SKW80]|nr:DUF1802 family protein [Oscillatoriaceae bacterium SKYG93]MCX8120096.1 DUF1802 family protein [Oscillatoriaceae bacterium SKW80]MDW8453022.1 DUF1802 family protein [Oscillatoriaceae cyanobacterium SKYGB_i_bin93]HIK29067.1 DUF1802 family protein [Oscillatoriaceae cyanobacterium M7585_C2015_266]
MRSPITRALKEWAIAIKALETGKTIMLLRKGGIREQGGHFTVTSTQVLLYPTYEHQKPDLLKPEYACQIKTVPSGWHPETIPIGSRAEIIEILPVTAESTVAALLPYHIWNEKFVSERLKWKPRNPLYILLLRTYRLQEEREIPYLPEYGGCRSWIDLATPFDIERAQPILSDAEFAQQVTAIRRAVHG